MLLNKEHEHLRTFYAIVPALCISWVEASLQAKDAIAVYHLSDISGEQLAEPGLNELMSPEKNHKMNFFSFLSCLKHCASREDLKAVVIYPDGQQLGLAQREEIGRRIKEIQKVISYTPYRFSRLSKV